MYRAGNHTCAGKIVCILAFVMTIMLTGVSCAESDRPISEKNVISASEDISSEEEKEEEQTLILEGIDYVLNTNTHKFHYPDCSSVERMAVKNKEYYTGTREEVIAMGYSPCGHCHP